MLIEILVGLTGLSLFLSLLSSGTSLWIVLQKVEDRKDWQKWVRQEELRLQAAANEAHQARIKIMDERLDECVKRQSQAEGLLQRTKREIKKAGVDPDDIPSHQLEPQITADRRLPMPPPLPPEIQKLMENGEASTTELTTPATRGIKKRGPWKKGNA